MYATKMPPHLFFQSFSSVSIPMCNISRLSLHFQQAQHSLLQGKISQMDVDILHPPISLLSFLTNSPAHSFLPTKPRYIDLIFSLEFDSQNFQSYNPSHAPTLSSSNKSPYFKMSKLFHIPHNILMHKDSTWYITIFNHLHSLQIFVITPQQKLYHL